MAATLGLVGAVCGAQAMNQPGPGTPAQKFVRGASQMTTTVQSEAIDAACAELHLSPEIVYVRRENGTLYPVPRDILATLADRSERAALEAHSVWAELPCKRCHTILPLVEFLSPDGIAEVCITCRETPPGTQERPGNGCPASP